jgi:anti-sigma regulatory factor (Ser/Thr protein kinase)
MTAPVATLDERTLYGDDRAPGATRGAIREILRGWPDNLVTNAELMASELVTNAATHTRSRGGKIHVAVIELADHRHVRVEVTDLGADTSPTARRPEPGSESGRGLFLVDALACEWGVNEHRDDGRVTVWFEAKAS